MGIRGLTRYISSDSDRYLEHYALHDCYLVIDGNCVSYLLYKWHATCNCAFGGDYDMYAQCVRNFFDELLRCNVTPLVLIDGGCEDKKLKTIITRTKEKIEIASNYTVSSQRSTKFLPLLLKEVFKDVMNEKDIKYAQCIFEADNIIAAIACLLNCPVLSFDSDFYIYGSLYIPFNTLVTDITPNPMGTGYMKRCKIYYVEKLFKVYTGLNQSLLHLAAVLLGNDYVKQHTFKNFFRHLPRLGTRWCINEEQRRIDDTFHWLRRRSLNEAVIEILSRIRKEERKHVLNTIEMVMNGYINASMNVLHTLGIPAEIISRANMHNRSSKIYKFEGDIYNLIFVDDRASELELNDEKESEDREVVNILNEKKLVSDESLVDNLPQWFINEFKQSKYSSYFIDLIIRKLYVCPTQIEDPLCVSSIIASSKIINVIYGLLVSGVEGRKTGMEYITRDDKKIKRYQLEYSDNILGYKLPPLLNLRELSIINRRDILNITLTISITSCINEIPSNWMLYIATIRYWINQQQEPSKFTCHVYALLFALLFNIIDYKIGFYRTQSKFYQKFNRTPNDIKHERKTRNDQSQYSVNATLVEAIHEVDTDDCLIMATFFVSNFEIDQILYWQPKTFNISIVHGFAEFQNCLRHSMNLNALLGYPYEQTKVANVYNGTLLYNLCTNFKKLDNIETYINLILQDSPSLSRLFNVLLLKVKPLLNAALEKKADKCQK